MRLLLAEKAGLKEGDVILGFDGQAIDSAGAIASGATSMCDSEKRPTGTWSPPAMMAPGLGASA